jgi:hypothetical protein
LLAVLVLSFLKTMADFVPANRSHQELLDDLRSGAASTVSVYAHDGEIQAQWSTGFLSQKQEEYQFPGGFPDQYDSVAEFEDNVRSALGPHAPAVHFVPYADSGPRALELLVPVAYPTAVSSPWLRDATYVIGFALLGVMCIRWRRHRAGGAGLWLLLSVVTGSGFFAYLWSEPAPLLPLPGRSPAGTVAPLTRELVIRDTVLCSAVLAVLAAAFFVLR